MNQPVFDRVREMMRNSPSASSNAMKWLEKKIGEVGVISPSEILKDSFRMSPNIFIGNMFMFLYDPKMKKTLPYYDKFPLIIPIDIQPDGFLGLNLHYLSPKYRLALLDKMIQISNKQATDNFELTWKTLKGVSKLKEVEPCIKHYLANHVASRFISISPQDWPIAIFLPVEKFAKQSKETVWKKSLDHIQARTHLQRKALEK